MEKKILLLIIGIVLLLLTFVMGLSYFGIDLNAPSRDIYKSLRRETRKVRDYAWDVYRDKNGNTINGANVIAVYKDKMYIGQGSKILSFDGNTWSTSYEGNLLRGDVYSFVVFEDKLFAGVGRVGGFPEEFSGAGDILAFDGKNWTLSYDGPEEAIYALAKFGKRLYAGQGWSPGDADVLVYDNGEWETSFDGDQEKIKALVVYADRLYAGTGFGKDKISVFDGQSWEISYEGKSNAGQASITSFQIYDSKLYAGRSSFELEFTDLVPKVLVLDGDNWDVAYSIPFRSKSDIVAAKDVSALAEYDGVLFAGQGFFPEAGDILLFDGENWKISFDGSHDQITSFAAYKGVFYASQGVGDDAPLLFLK